MRIHLKYFPADIRDQYQIDGLIAADGYVYMKTIKVIYGLKQSSIIAYNHLIYHMDPHVYHPVTFTTVLWAHKTRKTNLCLCVDDFGVKYFTKDDANHLLDSLKMHYAFLTYCEGRNYLGLTIYWNYSKEYVDTSMPEYVKKALDRHQHPRPKIPQSSPYFWTVPRYKKYSKWNQIQTIANILTRKPPKE